MLVARPDWTRPSVSRSGLRAIRHRRFRLTVTLPLPRFGLPPLPCNATGGVASHRRETGDVSHRGVDAASAHRVATANAVVVAAWTAHHEELFAFLVRNPRPSGVAEDLLQEAFLRLTTEVRADPAPDNVRAWLYRVAANLATTPRHRRAPVSTAFRGIARLGKPPRCPGERTRGRLPPARGPGRARRRVLADLRPRHPGRPFSFPARASAAPRSQAPRSAAARPQPHPALPDPAHAVSRTPRFPGGRPMKPHDTFLELRPHRALDFPLASSRPWPPRAAPRPAARPAARGPRAPGRCPGARAPAPVILPERRRAEILAAALHPPVVRNPVRLLVVAALLGCSSWAPYAVGSELLRRMDDDLGVVLPVPSQAPRRRRRRPRARPRSNQPAAWP